MILYRTLYAPSPSFLFLQHIRYKVESTTPELNIIPFAWIALRSITEQNKPPYREES